MELILLSLGGSLATVLMHLTAAVGDSLREAYVTLAHRRRDD